MEASLEKKLLARRCEEGDGWRLQGRAFAGVQENLSHTANGTFCNYHRCVSLRQHLRLRPVVAAAVAKANMRALGIVPRSEDSSSLWQDNALIAPVCAGPCPALPAPSAPVPAAAAAAASPSCVSSFSGCMSLLRLRRRLAA